MPGRVPGREIFKEVLRENPALRRRVRLQLLFDWRITSGTPGRFSVRVIT